MLQIKDITKVYEIGKKKDKNYQTVQALNGIDLEFRQSEFVSILGPSGCGKTTLLNIIGGLDKYTSGDLIINGKSTKEFKDKDWDNYRNHSVGFVFQSYNLIHHQTILQNVELALTLSGVKRKERKAKALEALDKVGLKDRANNLPNQLSGGQMQRVAIARAIVNDPEIILADEPTGALDSKTSVQIMDLLKEISKEKLIIMVTHNPDLAQTYSTRIIKLKDGDVLSDSNPYSSKEDKPTKQLSKKTANNKENQKNSDGENDITTDNESNPKKPKKRMSFFTALSLSFKNLLTKKARTILVSFAGSIGIIGIALILAVSSGFSGYIDKVQEDTLSSYPIVIEEQSVNYMNLMTSMFSGDNEVNHDSDAVYSNDSLTSMLDSFANALQSNDMKSFNIYLQEHYGEIEKYVNAIKYSYNLDLHIYDTVDTEFAKPISPGSDVLYELSVYYALKYLGKNANIAVERTDTGAILTSNGDTASEARFFGTISHIKDDKKNVDASKIYEEFKTNGTYALSETEISVILFGIFGISIDSYKNSDLGLFNEMIDNKSFVQSQYDLVAGEWNKDDVYVLGGKQYVDTLLVLNKNNELDEYLLYALGLMNQTQIYQLLDGILEGKTETVKIDYNKIVGKEFKIYLESDSYYLDSGAYKQTENKTPASDNANNYITMRISGIVKTNDETQGGALDNGIVYPKALTDECIDKFNTAAATNPYLLPIDRLNPSKIAIYANSFEMKEIIEDFISTYNAGVDEDKKITYTDYMSLMMSAVSSIVDIVSYVLIAFVSVSLIVSSIMIGIITYISVLERTKEIGVLRSVGASKRDIKRVFTAESLIIGFASGALGIIVTLLLCIPINIIFKMFTGIGTIASLPPVGGIVLVFISMMLTFIAGLIPAKVASKKDPVIALRSE